jgi:tRNA (cmo5U34)-methyltransferase
MSLNVTNACIVHYPENPDRFVFDSEVSRVFEDMARRSIPMYEEVHRLHVAMLREVFSRENAVVVDIGASRGRFFKEVCHQTGVQVREGSPTFQFYAVDTSPHMLHQLKKEMPWVRTLCREAQALPDLEEKADIVCLFYVLQFVEKDEDRRTVLEWAHRNLKEGGYLLLGQKHHVTATFEIDFNKEYYSFRMRQGYTEDEIRAKTKALKNSMWPIRPEWLEDLCVEAGFSDYVETTRWLQFSTSMCKK